MRRRFRQLLQSLMTVPSADINMRRRGRVTIILAFGMLVAVAMALPVALSVPDRAMSLTALAAGTGFYILAILVARRGKVNYGALLTIFPTTLIIAGTILYSGTLQIRPFYLLLSVLIATLTLRPRGIWIVACINLMALALLTLAVSNTQPLDMFERQALTGAVILIVITSLVGSLGSSSVQSALASADEARQQGEQANAELRLRIAEHEQAEARFAAIFNTSPLGILIISLETGRIIDLNPSFADLVGYRRADLIGGQLTRMAFWDEPLDRDGMVAAAFSGKPTELEIRYHRSDGELRDALVSLMPIGINGERCILSIYIDITDRLRAEANLRQANERFELAAAVVQAMICEQDLVHDRVVRSQGITTVLGYPPDQGPVTRGWWDERLHPDDRERVLAEVDALMVDASTYELEYRLLHHDGSYRSMSDHGMIIRDDDGHPVRIISSMLDITERRRLEAQYLQSQKMESIGRLAGGIAHDFNNLLTVINGAAALAYAQLPETHQVRADLHTILDTSHRAARLVQQLLAFARRQILEPQNLELNQLIHDIHELLQRLLGTTASMQLDLAADLGLVRADPSQIEQVLINLIVNARDAMPDGGLVRIATRNIELDEDYVAAHVGAQVGSYVMLVVSDNGSGIAPDVRSRIFEPFFTTKETGKGSGLGLATCYGIIKQHGGSIWCESEPGQGTTFNIYLPRLP